MKTKFNPLTFSYETPDGTSVAAEICEGDSPSDAFRAAAIREQQRKPLTDEEIGVCLDVGDGSMSKIIQAIEAKLRSKNEDRN